jgi:hypothetical protein
MLQAQRFESSIVLVSHASTWAEHKIRYWLDAHLFFNRTGIARNEVYFCHDRQDKAAICQRERVSHFIDDRLEVLQHLQGVVDHRYLFGTSTMPVDAAGLPPVLTCCENWAAVCDSLLPERGKESRWSQAA